MHRSKLSFAAAALVAGTALVLSACSSTPIDPTAGMSPNQIYADAMDNLNSGGYDKAIPLFEKLEGRAAGTVLAQQAQIEKAYAQYKNGEPIMAMATLDRFIKLHPTSPAVDYALYLKGLVNFNDDLGILSSVTRQDLAERDQKAAKESFDAFKELVARFPQSRYTPDATARMRYIVNSLAQSEIHVARYYYQRGAYVAAINRAQTAVREYQGTPALEEALAIMVQSYEALGMAQLRDDAKRVLEQNFPHSTYLTQGIKPDTLPWWKLW